MSGTRFLIVDVFAEARYAGNQLAVFLDAGDIPAERMQTLAREMNFAESTFILSNEVRDGGFDVRIFTPKEEVPFAGHPTLGTAYVIRRELLNGRAERVALNLGVGQIPVTFESDDDGAELLWMHQKPPEFGQELSAHEVGPVIHLDPGAIDSRFPVQEVSTGLPFLLVPLVDLDAVRRSRIDRDGYDRLVAERNLKAIFVFCAETYSPENQINARMFADDFGVLEDPATGSANGCLAGYLVRHRYFGTDTVEVRVEQGYEIDRPSRLYLKARELPGEIEVFVGGRVFPVAEGALL